MAAVTASNKTSCEIVFRDLRATLNTVIETGKQTDSPKIEAARDVILALENMKNAFSFNNIFSKEETKIDRIDQDRLATLRGMVTASQSDNNEVLLNIPARMQALISALGLPQWRPCLTGVNPQYVTVIGNEFTVSFSGKFKYAADAQYVPFLTLPGQRQFNPIKATTDCLTFRVTYIFKDATNDKRGLVAATLTVPFKNELMPKDRRVFTYNILLGALPLAPAKNIKVTYSWTVIQPGIATPYLSPLTIHDGKDLPASISNEKKVHFLASEGSHINKEIVEVISSPEHTRGRHESAIIEKTDTYVAVKLRVENEENQVSSVGLRVKFDEIPQIKVVQTSEPEEVVLRWGQEKELQQKNFKVEYDSSDGRHFVITGVDNTKPYLKVVDRNGKHFLIAEAPKDL